MNKTYLIAAGVAAFMMAGCVVEGGRYHSGGRVSVGIAGYDGYYDDYYGPFYDGYWGNDGFFYYSGGEGRPFLRDEGHHFRREAGEGFHAVHGHGAGEHRG
jgi:hypothetical protein